MKKILLTGGNGFIGKNILESFLVQKYQIIAPRSFELNLLDTKQVDTFFSENFFDVILHAAAKPGHRNAKDPVNLFYSNVLMFENLLRHKSKFEKFINFGSGAIYDTSRDITNIKEENIYQKIPSDEHGFCKYIQAKRLEAENKILGKTKFINFNIFGIFGKYEDWEIRFISNVICKILYNLPITIKQNKRFSYLYIDDLMPIIEYFIENDAQHTNYNVVPNETYELLEIAQMLQKTFGKKSEIIIKQEGYAKDYTANNSRLKEEYKNLIYTNLEASLFSLYNFYKENLTQIDKNLLLNDK